METTTKIYKKHNSFHEMHIAKGETSPLEQTKRALIVLKGNDNWPENWTELLGQVCAHLEGSSSSDSNELFQITPFVADEMFLLSDEELPRFLFHRYRYEVFPSALRLDERDPRGLDGDRPCCGPGPRTAALPLYRGCVGPVTARADDEYPERRRAL